MAQYYAPSVEQMEVKRGLILFEPDEDGNATVFLQFVACSHFGHIDVDVELLGGFDGEVEILGFFLFTRENDLPLVVFHFEVQAVADRFV